MDLREMRYIVEIASTRNITKAASNLYISQPALSKALKKTEIELGMPLFFREGKFMDPTDAGKLILERGEQILKNFDTLGVELQEIKSMKRGKVVFGIPSIIVAIGFPDIIMHFRRNYPGITLEIRESGSRHLENMIIEGTLDLAISMRPVLSDELSEIPLARDQILCVMNPDHPLSKEPGITLQHLSSFPFNTLPQHFAVYQYLISQFHEAGITPNVNSTSPTCEFLLKISQMSGEICVLPAPCVRHYDTSGMCLVPFKPALTWELCIVYKKNAFMTEATKALITCIQHSIEPAQF